MGNILFSDRWVEEVMTGSRLDTVPVVSEVPLSVPLVIVAFRYLDMASLRKKSREDMVQTLL